MKPKHTPQEIEKQIEKYYSKWSERGLNEYEKIALRHLEEQYIKVKSVTESEVKNK